MTFCKRCGHKKLDHDNGIGACNIDDCGCDSFVAPSPSKELPALRTQYEQLDKDLAAANAARDALSMEVEALKREREMLYTSLTSVRTLLKGVLKEIDSKADRASVTTMIREVLRVSPETRSEDRAQIVAWMKKRAEEIRARSRGADPLAVSVMTIQAAAFHDIAMMIERGEYLPTAKAAS